MHLLKPVIAALLPCLLLLAACAPRAGAQEQAAERPNILIILADDLAYSDIAPYGGEIDTPNLSRLADNGITFSYFHTSPMCSPSRAMLLTGVAQHRTGYGSMAEFLSENQRGQPGYEGYLNDRVVTLAEILREEGYATYMTGKWHLGGESNPAQRGFDRSFTLVQGAGSHFDDSGYADFMPTVTYLRDGAPADLPEDFYSSDFYTDEMIRYIDEGREADAPFFGYLSFTAPHWPLHAPAETIAKYEDRYLEGWEALRSNRFAALQRIGMVPPDAVLAPSLDSVPDWDSLTPEQQRYQARLMAVYAAMVDRLDQNIGRILDHLERTGELDNTIIIFTSDNGPEAIDFTTDPIFPPATDWVAENFDNSLESLGSAESYPFYGRPWAQAGAAGHRYYKTFVAQGGIHSPLIISWPGRIDSGGRTRAFATLVDIAPTLLDMAGVARPGPRFAGRLIETMTGRSMLPYLTGEAEGIYPEWDGQGFELFGNEAFIAGDWKIMRLRAPAGSGEWALYNLARDPNELTDLSAAEPEIFARLMERHQAYLRDNGVILPPDDFNMFAAAGADGEDGH
ncbi:arylsulfatase [Parasphingopyxis algicola]|uniref:arylsulfatase n=1 Tax=Parasphingopyxis algicola TaxID=2026624 RepID=UPI0015A4CC9C|nr:arylsulfatase [Parasphingopyxis algicola]QLC25397.1 arylsulfatase [Parasphingopyxis algicola]